MGARGARGGREGREGGEGRAPPAACGISRWRGSAAARAAGPGCPRRRSKTWRATRSRGRPPRSRGRPPRRRGSDWG
eukprot:5910788-Prymnesium_polylepis.1